MRCKITCRVSTLIQNCRDMRAGLVLSSTHFTRSFIRGRGLRSRRACVVDVIQHLNDLLDPPLLPTPPGHSLSNSTREMPQGPLTSSLQNWQREQVALPTSSGTRGRGCGSQNCGPRNRAPPTS